MQEPQAVVVDTGVVSFLFKQNQLRRAYETHLIGKLLVISPMTLAEFERWTVPDQLGVLSRVLFGVGLAPAGTEVWEDLARDAVIHQGEKALSQPREPHAHRPTGRNPQPSKSTIAATRRLLRLVPSLFSIQ